MKIGFAALNYRRRALPVTLLSLAALAAGFAVGTAAHRWPNPVLAAAAAFLQPVGDLWLKGLQMIALPLIVAHLMAAIIGAERTRDAGKLSGYTFLWFFVLLVAVGLFTIAAGSALINWFPVSDSARAAMQASFQSASRAAPPGGTGSLKDWLLNLIPTNIFRAASDGEMLPVIVAALLFAVAIRGVSEEHRLLFEKLLRAMAEATMNLAGYLLRVLPLAVFALTFTASAKSGPVIVGGIAYYVVAVSVLLVAVTLILYPLTWWLGGVPPWRFGKAMLPVQAIAVATRSSLASLPALLDCGRQRLGLPPAVATFVLPVATSVFKLNRTISSPLKLIVLGHLCGLHVDTPLKLFFVVVATLLSFGSPGLPSGGSLVTLPLYLAAGLPLQGIVLLNAVDSIPDIFKTLLNVTADMSVATIVARAAGLRLASHAVAQTEVLKPAMAGIAGEVSEAS